MKICLEGAKPNPTKFLVMIKTLQANCNLAWKQKNRSVNDQWEWKLN